MDAQPHTSHLVVRLSGDLGTKARQTRNRFQDQLVRAVSDALVSNRIPHELARRRERLLVACESHWLERAADCVSRVFGVQSVALAESRPGTDLDVVVRDGVEVFSAAVRGRRFAVRARRVGDRGPTDVSGRDVELALGTALLPDSAGVDLGAPEVTARVELYEGRAYFIREQRSGPGGLPIGVEGRAVALVSGGFDSAVAVWQLQRRGVSFDTVFCNLGGESHQLGVLRVMKELADNWSYGSRPRLHAIDFDPVARDLRAQADTRYWQVLLKRLMLRAAERVAFETRGLAIVTGEAVGQVSSQTLPNLAVISGATRLPILRPLVGSNKDEIIARAEQIGTAALSAVVQEYCAMVPRRPATSAKEEAILANEERLDLGLLARCVAERTVFDLRELDLDAIGIPELELDHVPPDTTLIDLRSRAAYQSWHYPGALQLDFGRALEAYPAFEAGRGYLLVCEFGLKSAHLAEQMRAHGLAAHHFRGGLKALLRHAHERGVAHAAVDQPVSLGDAEPDEPNC